MEFKSDLNFISKEDDNHFILSQEESSLDLFFSRFLQLLFTEPIYSEKKNENKAKAIELMKKMKNATQIKNDFEDLGTLWGYTALKFNERAKLTFLCLLKIWKKSPEIFDPLNQELKNIYIASIGGGPGNDLLGFVLFYFRIIKKKSWNEISSSLKKDKENKLNLNQLQEEKNNSLTEIESKLKDLNIRTEKNMKLMIFEYVDGWKSIVQKVSETFGNEVKYYHADVTLPLDHFENEVLASTCNLIQVYLFSFVLHESKKWKDFLSQLWKASKVGTLFYFNDPRKFELKKVVLHFEAFWIENKNCWWIQDSLIVVKSIPEIT